jgi:chromosome partitioning protein
VSGNKFNINETRAIARHFYSSSKGHISKKIHVFYNFKGGTGKTSLCYQTAVHLSLLGFSVLAIDLDPQAHLSSMFRIPEDWNGPTMYDIMINGKPIKESISSPLPGLDLIASNISLTRIEVPLTVRAKREEILKNILSPIRDAYDFIIIDTNPTISNLNMNALVASEKINIVCETQPFSLAGLRVLVEEMNNFFGEMKITPDYSIIPNKYEVKTATAQEVLGALRQGFGGHVSNSVVRKSEEINIAAKKKLPLIAFCKPKSIGLEDIIDLVDEVVDDSVEKTKTKEAA